MMLTNVGSKRYASLGCSDKHCSEIALGQAFFNSKLSPNLCTFVFDLTHPGLNLSESVRTIAHLLKCRFTENSQPKIEYRVTDDLSLHQLISCMLINTPQSIISDLVFYIKSKLDLSELQSEEFVPSRFFKAVFQIEKCIHEYAESCSAVDRRVVTAGLDRFHNLHLDDSSFLAPRLDWSRLIEADQWNYIHIPLKSNDRKGQLNILNDYLQMLISDQHMNPSRQYRTIILGLNYVTPWLSEQLLDLDMQGEFQGSEIIIAGDYPQSISEEGMYEYILNYWDKNELQHTDRPITCRSLLNLKNDIYSLSAGQTIVYQGE